VLERRLVADFEGVLNGHSALFAIHFLVVAHFKVFEVKFVNEFLLDTDLFFFAFLRFFFSKLEFNLTLHAAVLVDLKCPFADNPVVGVKFIEGVHVELVAQVHHLGRKGDRVILLSRTLLVNCL
jgi:hypothetical protein